MTVTFIKRRVPFPSVFVRINWNQPASSMPRSNIVTFKSSNMLHLLGNPPFFTLATFATCIVVFLLSISRISTAAICFIPSRFIPSFQLYRIFTAPFFHAGFIHILFNMIAWIMLSKTFENSLGSLGAIYVVIVLFIPLSALLQACMAFVVDALASTRFRTDCTVGISGVLFSMLVVNVHISGASSISFFGFFDVPAIWYPWILAALLQLLSPRLSFMGHLSGILMGYALAHGYLRVLTPSDEKLNQWEQTLRLTSLPSWKPNSSILDISYASRSFLPQTTSTSSSNSSSFVDRCRESWQRFSSWVANAFSSSERQSFSGQGQTLGGGARSTGAGRIPAHSRLLREAEAPSATAEAQTKNSVNAESATSDASDTAATQAEQPSNENP